MKKKEMIYDHFADMKSTNKWQSNYKLKLDEMKNYYQSF